MLLSGAMSTWLDNMAQEAMKISHLDAKEFTVSSPYTAPRNKEAYVVASASGFLQRALAA